MTRNDLRQRLRAIYATVRRMICGSGEPPYQDWSIFTPEAGMEYNSRPLAPLAAQDDLPSEADDFEASPRARWDSGREA